MLEIYFETFGCTANQNSTEIMKGLVRTGGLNLTTDINYADLIVINSCIVKQGAEEKIRKKITDLSKQGKKVILAGCMPRLNKDSLQNENIFLLDTSNTTKINELIIDIKEGTYDQEKYLKKNLEIKLNQPKIQKEKTIGITQISEGCLGKCNYCIVRLAKGKLYSYPQNQIIDSIKKDLKNGCKEIWITSQDNANYANELEKYLLPNLLKKILDLPEKFKLRIGMMNPDNVIQILPELIEIYKNEKMFKFLHMPIQSGSDKVLKEMKRGYTKKNVMKIINAFKKELPKISISTDIIVGYPTESEEDWKETIDLIKKIKPEILNRSNFTKRKGTPAENLKEISPTEMKKRSNELMKLHLEICKKNQESYKNWEGEVLVSQKGFGNTYLARSSNYKLFAVHSKNNLLGKTVNIKVKKTSPHYLLSELK